MTLASTRPPISGAPLPCSSINSSVLHYVIQWKGWLGAIDNCSRCEYKLQLPSIFNSNIFELRLLEKQKHAQAARRFCGPEKRRRHVLHELGLPAAVRAALHPPLHPRLPGGAARSPRRLCLLPAPGGYVTHVLRIEIMRLIDNDEIQLEDAGSALTQIKRV